MIELGAVVATPAALRFCEENKIDVLDLVRRHANGDDGEGLGKEDKKANRRAHEFGGRIFSAYTFEGGGRLWIISEADRSSTCVLTPGCY